uniref:39S ribosomal protein L23, mitochondrial n=1 Tax=Bos mutus grunniens TaxID=30521 RepID=A0A8B9X3R8_BOSMU
SSARGRDDLWTLSGPGTRVFRTNFFIQLVRPGTAQPEDTVQFRIPMDCLLGVKASVSPLPTGSNRRRDHRSVRIKQPDYKVAYVQLAHGQTFTFPDLFPKGSGPVAAPLTRTSGTRCWRSSSNVRAPTSARGVPSWFGL